MTAEHCCRQIGRLTVLRGLPDDIEEYFPALSDVPDERFTSAVDHALKTRTWFPTPAELRADCDAAGKPPAFSPPGSRFEAAVGGGYTATIVNPFNREHVITLNVDRVWRFDCDDCADSGWRSRRCPEMTCGRRVDHSPHEWVERCSCLEWNPTIKRRKEATAKYSQQPEKVGV